MKYSYFPGCSLKGLGRAYEESLLPVMRHLGVELQELEDWNCCGATAYMAVDEAKACVLAARNLALAEKQGGRPIMAPCAACYLVLNKTKHYFHDYPAMKETIDRALGAVGLHYSGDTPVRHPLDVLINDVTIEEISKKVVKPLKGLKVIPYYGCLLTRPYSTFDDQHNPSSLDKIIKAAGADVIDWPMKTMCCGGSETGTLPEVGLHLVYILLKEAVRRGGDVIATICPLCQFNLEAYQDKIASRYEKISMPVVYFSQILGLSLGLTPKDVGLQRALVPARPVLERMEVKNV
jgi:heterodisulfide reductase subunit B